MIDYNRVLPAVNTIGRDITLKELLDMFPDHVESGSRVICNPAPTDTDHDIFVLGGQSQESDDLLSLVTYNDGTEVLQSICNEFADEHYDSGVESYRIGELNFIIVRVQSEFEAIKYATALAASLNIRSKEDRYDLFRILRKYWQVKTSSTTSSI